jgi:hypothetical protein
MTIGPVVPVALAGLACPPGAAPLYAVATTSTSGAPRSHELGLLDPQTAAYEPLAAITVPAGAPGQVSANVIVALAVGQAAPFPTTTSTAAPAAVAAQAVPAFTG